MIRVRRDHIINSVLALPMHKPRVCCMSCPTECPRCLHVGCYVLAADSDNIARILLHHSNASSNSANRRPNSTGL